ncbi:carbohydrate-binding module family 50 protein [Paramyrothecium foliicola]|nr:carbohydrate-binding module family 50 protein [Paramyrothecium foliicola]
MKLSILLSTLAWTGSIVLAQDSSPGAPVHPGQPDNCNGWHTVVTGDNCQSVPAKYGITFDKFLEWNPAVSRDCLTNFWLSQAYCVRVGAKPSSTKASSTTTTRAASTTSTSRRTTSTATVSEKYSTRHPTLSFNITTTTIDMAWPPEKTKEGQPEACVNWHLVTPGEVCETLSVRYGIDVDDLIKWNPNLGEDCSGLLAEWWVCVGLTPQGSGAQFEWSTEPPDFTPPSDPTDHTRTTHPTADSSFVPSPSHGPMPSSCKGYHLVQGGQTCREVVAQYGLFTQQQFLDWNPVLKGNCDGLWSDTYYCVANFGDRLPLPSHATKAPATLPSGSPKDCVAWYEATDGDDCALIAEMFGTFDEKDFIGWNPSVLDDCDGIRDGAWYCVAKKDTPTTRTGDNPSVTTPPTSRPTQPGVSDKCTDWWLVGPSDTCQKIRTENGISQESLTKWNPAIDEDCEGLEVDKYICVGVDGEDSPPNTGPITSSTRASVSATTTGRSTTTSKATEEPIKVPQPVREGMAADCRRFYMQKPGEFCYDISVKNGVNLDDFYKWNPAVGNDCSNLWPDYYYCVGVSGSATTIGKRSVAAPTL